MIESNPNDEWIDWVWVVGLVLLFPMGILPGLVGLVIYLSSRDRG